MTSYWFSCPAKVQGFSLQLPLTSTSGPNGTPIQLLFQVWVNLKNKELVTYFYTTPHSRHQATPLPTSTLHRRHQATLSPLIQPLPSSSNHFPHFYTSSFFLLSRQIPTRHRPAALKFPRDTQPGSGQRHWLVTSAVGVWTHDVVHGSVTLMEKVVSWRSVSEAEWNGHVLCCCGSS